MAKVLLRPERLQEQSKNLMDLANDYRDLYKRSVKIIGKSKDGISTDLATNLQGKVTVCARNFDAACDSLEKASTVASRCAESYVNADQALRDMLENGDISIDESSKSTIISSPVSDQYIEGKWEHDFNIAVENMKNKEEFREGRSWGYDAYIHDYKGIYCESWSCWAMASMMQIECTGKLGESIGAIDKSAVQVGDRLQYYGVGCSSEEYGHSVFIIGVEEDGFLIGEGNWGQKVNYRKLPFSDIYYVKNVFRVPHQ